MSNALNHDNGISLKWNSVDETVPPMLWLNSFQCNGVNMDDSVRMGIDNGCQVNLNAFI